VIASFLFALQLGVTADHPNTDRWLSPDKFEHYAASAVIETSAYAAFRKLNMSNKGALAAATAVTIAAGVGKELLDRERGFKISAKDLTWDIAGLSSVFSVIRRRRDNKPLRDTRQSYPVLDSKVELKARKNDE